MASFRSDGVFIHGFWRTGSTWLWSRFREIDQTLCFYEPFHHCLSYLSAEAAETHSPSSWQSAHPKIGPYFSEYRSLIREDGGVRIFDPRISIEHFFPEGDLDTVDADYLASLGKFAKKSGRRPVYGFCRSLGRAGAIRSSFGGVHIVLIRNPFGVLNSALKSSMLSDYAKVAFPLRSRRALSRWGLDLERFCLPDIGTDDGLIWTSNYPISAVHLMLHIYIVGCFVGLLYADEVFDIDSASSELTYRNAAQSRLQNLTGLALDISGCAVPSGFGHIESGILALSVIAESLDAEIFSRPVEIANAICKDQGAEPHNDPVEQMAIVSRMFNEGMKSFIAEKCANGDDICFRNDDVVAFLQKRLGRLRADNLSLKAAEARLKAMEGTLSWRITRPLRSKLINKLRGR